MTTNTLHAIGTAGLSTRTPSAGWSRLVAELRALAAALLSPDSIIAEVEATQRLLRRAAALEATDPQGAARLREQASRIGIA